MKYLSLIILFLINSCCHTQKPITKIVIVEKSCLEDPSLPKWPILGEVSLDSECPEDKVCFTIDGAAELEKYLSAISYFKKQLDIICKEETK